MQLIRQRAYARAALVGNPSDGYHGRTISVILRRFWAEIVLYEWERTEIVLAEDDRCQFDSVQDLVRDVRLHGYYGGIRLIKATIKRFVEYCQSQNLPLHPRNFSIRYHSNIPRQVGLAGSSALVVATLRALTQFYGVEIPKDVLPSLALSVETGELGIPAGLQDRVVQVYEGLVYMDFTPEKTTLRNGLECGTYELLDPKLLPPLYVAYGTSISQPTEQTHLPLRAKYKASDPQVIDAMQELAEFASQAREALLRHDHSRLHTLMNDNFDLRRKIYTDACGICALDHHHVRMVELARCTGASANFAGSGGAIVGMYTDDAMLKAIRDRLGEGYEVIAVGVSEISIEYFANTSPMARGTAIFCPHPGPPPHPQVGTRRERG